MTYKDAENLIFSQLPFFQRDGVKAIKFGLKNIKLLCSHIDNPQNKFKSIHIAGTNGKGSTSHLLASVFQEAGYKTALYTSPHLKDFRERFKINGKLIPKKEVAEFVFLIKDAIKIINPTFFEVTVALAFYWFAKQEVDIAIIEVGLGGRLDSTNIINPELSIITTIGLDHQSILGDTLKEIAFEKAGIIKTMTPVVIGVELKETKPVFLEISASNNAPIVFSSEINTLSVKETKNFLSVLYEFENEKILIQSKLKGNYQKENIRTVIRAFIALKEKFSLDSKHLKSGIKNVIKNTRFKGRWQIISKNPLTICDTGHNADAWNIIISQLKQLNSKHYHLVLGFSKDKVLNEVLKDLPQPFTLYFTEFQSTRSLKPEEFISKGFKFDYNFKNVNSAYEFALSKFEKDDMIFIGGSTFVVAEFDKI